MVKSKRGAIMRDSLIIVASFLLGVLLVLTGALPQSLLSLDFESFSNYALYLLLFFVGVSIGMEADILQQVKRLPKKVLLLPLFAYAGAILASIIAYYILRGFNLSALSLPKIAAINSGMGYYSITAIMVGQACGAEIGSIALLVNLLRELLTVLLAPLMSRWFGRYAATASGGATAIDTTLPIIMKTDGTPMFAVAAYCGMFFTIAVPFLLTLILSLFSG